MMRGMRLGLVVTFLVAAVLLAAVRPGEAVGQTPEKGGVALGLKLRVGGRFDNVRMCVATDKGSKGGPAADISFFVDYGIAEDWTVSVDVPVMRPILFAAAFRMLQLEPTVSFNYRVRTDSKVDFIVGPTVGLSLHYGPDYASDRAKGKRSPSFFAMGAMMGAYLGLDFKRPGKTFNFQLGLTPYVTPMASIGSAEKHRGVVVGGLLDGAFRWGKE
jgi:hypothetical protein